MLRMLRWQQDFPYTPYSANQCPLTTVGKLLLHAHFWLTLLSYSSLPLCLAHRHFVPVYLPNCSLILHLKSALRNKCSAFCFTALFCVKKYALGLRRQPHLFRLADPCLRTTCSGRGRLEQLVDVSPEV